MPVMAQASDYRYVAGQGVVCGWSINDRTGMTTGSVNVTGKVQQLCYYVTTVDPVMPQYASTNAIGYALTANSTYYSYYPYKWNSDFNPESIDCNYTEQQQEGNGTLAHLYAKDLSIAKVQTTSSASCDINYQHIGSVLRIVCSAPQAMIPTELLLKTESSVIPATATANLLTQQVEWGGYSDEISIALDGVQLAKGQELVVYLMMPAVDLSAQTLTCTCKLNNGAKLRMATFKGPDMTAGKLYEANLVSSASNCKPMKSLAGHTTATGVEYPTVYAPDFEIDNDYKNYVVSITTGISNITSQCAAPYAEYSVSGVVSGTCNRGLVIQRMADGTTRKYIRK